MENRIAEFRKMRGLTQQQLSEILGLSNYTILQRYERNRRTPDVDVAIRIAHALGTTVEELFPLEESDDK